MGIIYNKISKQNKRVLKTNNYEEVKKLLDDRKKKVLQAIVEEYVNTAEPVSSNALTKNHGLDYSSATIRNEMAELEKCGYLDKTHTSSGRIPSEKGYRYYVDELLNENDISIEEVKYISDKKERFFYVEL